jgi:hypothetical protein
MRLGLLNHLALATVLATSAMALAQEPQQPTAQTSPVSDQQYLRLQQEVQSLEDVLKETRQQLRESRQQVDQLQISVDELKKHIGTASTVAAKDAGNAANGFSEMPDAIKLRDAVTQIRQQQDALQEQQEIQQAEIAQHEQTKVESMSKYPVRLTGLVLFNAFANDGVVDNIALPAIALPRQPGTSHGTTGASLEQTILGISATGPHVWGAQTSGEVSMDFFGGASSTAYPSATGVARLRVGGVTMNWKKDTLQVGVETPLISPLSPTTYVTVATPGLSGAGNLWTWAPQLRYEHRMTFSGDHTIAVELGLWDSPAAGWENTTSTTIVAASPGERSRFPGYESRVSYRSGQDERALQIGVSGYYSDQSYNNGVSVDSWAATADWKIPFTAHYQLSGEFYRGEALGGFGGGAYKDVIYGTSVVTGLTTTRGLNAIGGWSQFKIRPARLFEANLAYGQDTAYAGDFHQVVMPDSYSSYVLAARNRMIVGNLIFRPKTYLIFSPEYRRIMSWQITGPVNIANLFGISAGYQF